LFTVRALTKDLHEAVAERIPLNISHHPSDHSRVGLQACKLGIDGFDGRSVNDAGRGEGEVSL
jgi:hypothetical protein